MCAQITADLLIASMSFASLRAQRGGYEKTQTVLSKLTLYTMGTCLVPTVFAVIRLVLVSVSPKSVGIDWYMLPQFAALHSFSMLVFSMTLAKGTPTFVVNKSGAFLTPWYSVLKLHARLAQRSQRFA
jgi:hypothetical protein